MKAGELRYALAGVEQDKDVSAVMADNGPFWQEMACNALTMLRPMFKMNDQQGAAWDLVQGMLCGMK